MATARVEIIGLDKVTNGLDKGAKDAINNALKKVTLSIEREAKKASVVDTGVLASSIYSKSESMRGIIGSPMQYASFVEYGTEKMDARHMEGIMKIFGTGMFTYALSKLSGYIKDFEKMIADKIGKDME